MLYTQKEIIHTSSMSSSSNSDPCAINTHDAYNVKNHTLAIIAVLCASFAGAIIPIVGKRSPRLSMPPFLLVVGKCLGTGVLLGVGLVHMLVPAHESLTHVCLPEWLREDLGPLAFIICLLAIMLMHAIDIFSSSILYNFFSSAVEEDFLDLDENGPLLLESDSNAAARYEGHGHSHLAVGDYELNDLVSQRGQENVRHVVGAVFLEFGVSIHSIFVGLAIGVCHDDELFTLLIAICFHQFFEGVALGSRLVEASFRSCLEAVFAVIFTLSAPVGAAVGVVVITYRSLNTNSVSYLLLQGTLDAICAGILLYLGFGLLLGDFPRDMQKHCNGFARRFAMTLGLWTGAIVMMFLGKYA